MPAMADITRRRTGELLQQLFRILLNRPEGMKAKDALAELAAKSTLSDYEAGVYTDGTRRFEKIARFSTLGPVKAGWFLKTKGTWTISETGKAALKKFSDPEAFIRESDRLYREWSNARPEADSASDGNKCEVALESVADDRDVVETFEFAEEKAWDEIEKHLQGIGPYDLQEMVASLLKAMRYHIAWVSPPGKDKGIDILAFTDPLGTSAPRIKVQVKRHKEKVAVDGLRSFLAVLGDGDVGIFINIGGFTREAEDLARTQEKRRITLLDAEKFFDLWVENYKKLDEGASRRMPLRPIWFLAPVE